jgi:tetratricopeptide (TPR) repeat protein
MDYPKWQKLLKDVAEEYSLTEILSTTLEAKFPRPNYVAYDYVLREPGKLKKEGLTKSGLSDRLTALFNKFDFLENEERYKAKALGRYLNRRYEQDPDSIATNPPPIQPPQPRQIGSQYPPIPHWVGRDELLCQLHHDLQQGYQVMVLRGQGGIGKTSLAVKLMAACGIEPLTSTPTANCSYDNALFFKVDNGDGFDAIASVFLDAFGLGADRAATPAETIDLILARLQQERWLVVIDNLESLLEVDRRRAKSTDVGELLNRFANVAHKSQIAITSRTFPDDLNDPRGRSFNSSVVADRVIPGISTEAGIQLLKDLGARDIQADLEWIAGQVNNVLILGWLAAYSRNQPGRLRNKPEIVTNEAKPIVRAQWELQGAPAQDLLQRMCVLRIAMDAPALTTLRLLQADGEAIESTPEAAEVTEELLIGLGKSDLVQCLYDESLYENRYVLHPLMAETLQDIFAEDLRQLWHYAARLYGSFDLPEDEYGELDFRSFEDMRFILEEFHFYWLSGTNRKGLIGIFVGAILPKLRRWCYWDLAEEWLNKCLTVETELGDRAGMATSWGVLGDIARNRGDYDKAEDLYNRCLKVETELGDRAGMATSWGVLGDIARNRGDYDKAEDLYNRSLTVYTELGDRAGMASSWGALGVLERERGNLDVAETWLKQALTAVKNLQMPERIASFNWSLALLYRAKGEEQTAQEHYAISYDLYTKLGAKGDLEEMENEWTIS